MKEASELENRLVEDERLRAKEDMIRQGKDAHSTTIMPKYKMDDRLKVYKEVDAPPSNMYIGLGWDETHDQKRKHYRQFYNDELENNTAIFERKSPFNSYPLKKGQARGASTGMFSSGKTDDTGNASTE